MASTIIKAVAAMIVSLILAFGSSVTPVFPEVKQTEKKPIESLVFEMKKYDYIVSPDGDDSFSGKLTEVNSDRTDGPLRTVFEAQRRLRGLVNADVILGKVTVWLRGGTYYLDRAITFTSEDLPNVTYCAYNGETPVFSAGKSVGENGWQTETVNGVTVWTTQVDFDFNTLYTDNTVLPCTRLPETGYFTVKSQNTTDSLYTPETTPWEYTLGEKAFDVNKEDLQSLNSFKNLGDIRVRVLHYWKDELFNIKSYDSENGTLKFDKPNSMSCKAGDRYFLENVFEALNTPGEWYLDKPENKLYYVPQSTDDINTLRLSAGGLRKILGIDGVNSIAFKGITFRDTDFCVINYTDHDEYGFDRYMEHPQAAYSVPAAINVTNAHGIVFDACTVINVGMSGIKFSRNVQDSSVTRCLLQNIGGNAVYIHGENDENATLDTNISVTDNHIYKYGRQFANAIGVLLVHANRCTISNNEIHDGFYTAISAGWVWGYSFNITDYLTIENNRIYDIGQGWLSDMGGIYTLGMQPHTVIRGNVINNVAADPDEGGYGGWGVYLDEGSSGILVEKNLAFDCGSNAFHQHYGKENLIRNNIFALSKDGQARISRNEEHLSAMFEHNIFVGDNQPMYASVEKGKFTDNSNLYWDYSRRCLVVSSKGEDMMIKNRLGTIIMKSLGLYDNAVFRDPMFKNAKEFDFTLAVNSPAMEMGFEPWDYGTAGTISLIETK